MFSLSSCLFQSKSEVHGLGQSWLMEALKKGSKDLVCLGPEMVVLKSGSEEPVCLVTQMVVLE